MTSISSYLILMIPYAAVILILVLQPERLKELRRWIGMRRKLPQV